jgi:hypothetical protein
MQRRSVLGLAVGLGLYLSACGGSDTTSPSPSPSPTPVPVAASVSTVSIVGPRVVPTGSDVTYTATATMTTGAVLTSVRPTAWSLDNGDIASVNSANDGVGELKGKREGTVTLIAKYQNQTGILSVEVRDARPHTTGANLRISYAPDPATGRATACPGPNVGTPTWTFTETVAETLGVGFTQENVSFTLYDDSGAVVYTDTFAERYYFPPNSSFSEELCMGMFGLSSGFYADVYEGVDDVGNRRAFSGGRLRLLRPTASIVSGLLVPPTSRPLIHGERRRIR